MLPAHGFAEKDGTFVNHAGLAQAIRRGGPAAGECRTDGQVFFDLLGRRGLGAARDDAGGTGAEVPYFAPLACATEIGRVTA